MRYLIRILLFGVTFALIYTYADPLFTRLEDRLGPFTAIAVALSGVVLAKAFLAFENYVVPKIPSFDGKGPWDDGEHRRAMIEGITAYGSYLTSAFATEWWNWKITTQRLLTNSLFLVLVGSASLFVLEALLLTFGRHLLSEPITPFWVEVVVIALAVFALRHRVHEWNRARERSKFTTVLRHLIREAANLDFRSRKEEEAEPAEHSSENQLEQFLNKVLQSVHAVFERRLRLTLNVMFPALSDPERRLRPYLVYPPGEPYDRSAAFRPGEGAAGKAYQDGCMVYVPAIRSRHGIRMHLPDMNELGASDVQSGRRYKVEMDVYKKVEVEPYRSILCAPVMRSSGVCAVLNIDCRKRRPFNVADMEIADVAATLIGMAIERYQRESGRIIEGRG